MQVILSLVPRPDKISYLFRPSQVTGKFNSTVQRQIIVIGDWRTQRSRNS